MEQTTKGRESSLAWFKLAELVSRGEKEKALNFYRLLSHSFEERAYALQVEGDLLWAFEDEEALERYKQAAFLYKKEQKLTNALCVYEHLHTLKPNDYGYLLRLVEFYTRLDWPEKFKDRFTLLLNLEVLKTISSELAWEAVEMVFALCREQQEAVGKSSEVLGVLIELLKMKKPEFAVRVQQLCEGPVHRNPAEEPAK